MKRTSLSQASPRPHARWNPELPFASHYSISLHKHRTFWSDASKGSAGYETGQSQSFTWSGLDSGTYYLLIKTNRKPPSSVYKLEGSITVST